MVFAVRLVLAFLPKDNIVMLVLALVLTPILLINLLFAGPVVIAKRVPMVTPEQARYYRDAALAVSNSTKSPCNSGVIVNWQEVIAIDAVRLKQIFENINKNRANELTQKFIVQTGT